MNIRLQSTLVLALIVIPSLADAQQRARRSWVFGVEVGLNGSRPDAYASGTYPARDSSELDLTCASHTVEYLGFSVGRRAADWLHLDAVVSAQASSASRCAFILLQPKEFFEGRYVGRTTTGDDYIATMLRAVIDPGNANLRPRAVVGLGYIPKKHVAHLAVGAGVSAGGSRTRFVSEFGLLMSHVKWSRIIGEYDDYGQTLVREWTETGTSTPRQFYGRVGVEF